jgi:hypothetical protein
LPNEEKSPKPNEIIFAGQSSQGWSLVSMYYSDLKNLYKGKIVSTEKNWASQSTQIF